MPVAVVWAMGALGWYRVVLAVAPLALLVGAAPVVRAGVCGRIRCAFTAHRIRSGCVEALVVNRRGRVPHALWTATPLVAGRH